ncbi:lysylphosphatidylglycerol synthase domain-containing protein [Kribbella sp. NBC_00709]|uniref:lysylphosphatidylglycerol synthase domain-containing protein n=1 Tax=Kribbella sp. NBC_00709 TaxID=2975972 RepID=UPI002E2D6860|nr:lysylphosphatidylglycerol synthase domain-containing protein [Kribbella sp. NBC_00709]
MAESSPPAVPTPRVARRKIPKPVVLLARLIIIGVVAWLLLGLLRGVDWSEVGYALTHLSPWQIGVLLICIVIRRSILAAPLALLIAGLSYLRAMISDVAAAAVATIAPSPGDVVLRLAMLRSWGIDATDAASGLTLSTTLFYVARLAAPLLGFVIFWAAGDFYAPFAWSGLLFGAGAVVLLVGLLYALRAERTAATIGRLLGRLIRRVRPSSQGPAVWEERLVSFQSHSAGRMRERGWLAMLSQLLLIGVEAGVLVLCLGFVGVKLDGPTVLVMFCSFMVIYPLTGLPLMGAGVLDATYAAFVSDHTAVEATDLVAGLLVWRVAVQFLPVVVGLLIIVVWRRFTWNG